MKSRPFGDQPRNNPARIGLLSALSGLLLILAALAASQAHAAAAPARIGEPPKRPLRFEARTPLCVVPGKSRAPDCYEPSFPIRAAFYYPWFPQAWSQQGLSLFTHYAPSLGLYSSRSREAIRENIAAMQYGGIAAGIASWWGRGSATDRAVPDLLAVTNERRSRFRWAVYYEPEAQGDPSIARITADLKYIRGSYGANRAYLRVGRKFVIFVYTDAMDGAAMVERWTAANAAIGNQAYLNLKVFPGYRSSRRQPQSWHQYAPAQSENVQAGYSFTISPGFFKANESAPRLARDLTRWRSNVENMVASRAPWQLVTTFNEWGEGTAVESADEWATPSGKGAYMDTLRAIR